MIILCMKCGKVEKYKVTKYFHQISFFDVNDKCIETVEAVADRYTKPRCPKCGRIVKFFKETEEL